MQINFIHIRDHDDDGELINFGGATIAYTAKKKEDSFRIKFAVAECVETDRFVKSIGRNISSFRLQRGLPEDIMGDFEIPLNLEDEIQKLIVYEYLDYKAQFWEREYPDLNIRHFWYPHKPGYVITPEEEEE